MAAWTTLKHLEQQITRLSMRDKLKLITCISERLNFTPLDIEKKGTIPRHGTAIAP